MSFLKKLKNDINIEESTEKKKTNVSAKQEDKQETKPKQKSKKVDEHWLKPEGQLAVDVFNTDIEFCIHAVIAGVSSEELDISIENEMLIIKGVRKKPEINKEKNYFYQECYWGPFSRQIILPEDADPNKTKASLQKGILTIRIPRAIQIRKKKINVISTD